MNTLPQKTIVTNLSYKITNEIINIHKNILINSGKVVNQESILLTPMVWQSILKNKAREFVRFKIFVHTSKNHELQINYSGFVLDDVLQQKLNGLIKMTINKSE